MQVEKKLTLRNYSIKENLTIEDKDVELINCDIHGTMILENSKCRIENCTFTKDKEEILYPNILILNSQVQINNTLILKSKNSHGIEAENSWIKIRNITVKELEGCGIILTQSVFDIDTATLTQNGSEESEFSQIYINNSKGRIKNSSVANSINSNGIYITNQSQIEITNTNICCNPRNGIAIDEYSSVSLTKCNIKRNGDEYNETIQIWVNNSTLAAKECNIENGICGIYIQKGSNAEITDCKISNNLGGVCIFESSTVLINQSTILENLNRPQIWAENSKLKLYNSTIHANQKILLFAENLNLLETKGCNIPKDRLSIKDCRNVIIESYR
ncbi:right-handed parallel beta-helix repeat-containing protein [Hippea alviniae]|uniref:right-handed parallel beta-helix repeat-containing protein n=1 Tax=Hippea alviniae TaxID=1279027 RepID=UPI000412F01A|nr:right-handed parallel beta-helix repeat-containing protein [Hippea alviniae]